MLARARDPASRQVAIGWIHKAAEGGLAMAQDQLGTLHLQGRGVPQSTARALTWIRRPAHRGASAAQLELADLYQAGVLVPLNLEKAYYWYRIASLGQDGDVHILNSEAVLASARRRADRMAPMLSSAQRAAVMARVVAWKLLPSTPYVGVVSHLAVTVR